MIDARVSFFSRHEFLIRRLHSLSGLIPVGAYMVVHLLVNASLLDGVGSFQRFVYQIHSLGAILPLVEWVFIFGPILFHAIVGVWIMRIGQSNVTQYRFVANWRYQLQRWTGVIAIFFIFFHVFHLHGWFQTDAWLANVAHPIGMARFRPYNAASTLAESINGYFWPAFYLIGILACVFHLANGIWTMGITWGVWLTPRAQRHASYVCGAFGLLLAFVGLGALFATRQVDIDQAHRIENAMYKARINSGELKPNPHKRSEPEPAELQSAAHELIPDSSEGL